MTREGRHFGPLAELAGSSSRFRGRARSRLSALALLAGVSLIARPATAADVTIDLFAPRVFASDGEGDFVSLPPDFDPSPRIFNATATDGGGSGTLKATPMSSGGGITLTSSGSCQAGASSGSVADADLVVEFTTTVPTFFSLTGRLEASDSDDLAESSVRLTSATVPGPPIVAVALPDQGEQEDVDATGPLPVGSYQLTLACTADIGMEPFAALAKFDFTLVVGQSLGSGACCLTGGTCVELALADCQAQGQFQGVGSACSTPGICAVPEDVVDWINGFGGGFGVDANWDPADVPGETQTARFQLSGNYQVQNAAARVRRALVRNGTVALTGGPLELLEQSLALPSATLQDGGRLNLLAGSEVRSSHVSVGAGGSTGSGASVSGTGTRWRSSARFTVGDASFGELLVANGGTLESAESRIGENAEGQATVEGEDTSWTTGNVGVGNFGPGTLSITDGGLVTSGEGRLGLTLAGFGFVEVLGASAGGRASKWQLDTLRVGAGGVGTLTIDDGGNVSAGVLAEVGSQSFGGVTVAKNPSSLDAVRLVVGAGPLGGSLNITGGGRVIALDTTLGAGDGDGDVTVDSGSSLDDTFDAGTLSVRRGTLRLDGSQNIALMKSTRAVVAGPAANVVVSGALAAWTTDTLRIGGTGGPGTVTLDGGSISVTTGELFVDSVGTLAGHGTIFMPASSLPFAVTQLGTISPAIAVEDPPEARLDGRRAAAALLGPAPLVIDGNLTLGASAVLRISVAGPGSFGILRVTGAATLAGTLELRFVEGFLPAAGAAFDVLEVEGAVRGGFERVVVRGVGERLPFTAGVANGVLTLTTLADAKACSGPDADDDGLADCERCDDCVDDDGDGLVDRADPDCAPAADGTGAGSGGDAAARKTLGKCAAAAATVGAKLSALVAKQLQSCTDAVLACLQTKPGDAGCLTKARTTCGKAATALAQGGKVRQKARLAIAKTCGSKSPGAPPAVSFATLVAASGLGFDAEVARCAALATPLATVDDVIACIDRATVCRASALFATRVPRVSELLGIGGLAASVPPCLPAATEEVGALGDPKTVGKPLGKCQKAIAAAAKLPARLTKGYGACAAAVRTCVQLDDPTACLGKASATCAKAVAKLPTVTGAADVKLRAAVTKACGELDVAALLAAKGLRFGTAAVRCRALGVVAIDSAAALATCLSREHACGAATLVEATTPRLRELLGRAGVPLP